MFLSILCCGRSRFMHMVSVIFFRPTKSNHDSGANDGGNTYLLTIIYFFKHPLEQMFHLQHMWSLLEKSVPISDIKSVSCLAKI